MAIINPDLSGIVDGAVGDAADWTNPFHTIINEFNGNIDNDNIKTGANIARSKLLYGLVRHRQGGTTGAAAWNSVGTSNTDVTTVDTFIQCGAVNSSSSEVTVTFPTAFTYAPVVVAACGTAAGRGAVVVNTITTTSFKILVSNVESGGSVMTGDPVYWIAIGQ